MPLKNISAFKLLQDLHYWHCRRHHRRRHPHINVVVIINNTCITIKFNYDRNNSETSVKVYMFDIFSAELSLCIRSHRFSNGYTVLLYMSQVSDIGCALTKQIRKGATTFQASTMWPCIEVIPKIHIKCQKLFMKQQACSLASRHWHYGFDSAHNM